MALTQGISSAFIQAAHALGEIDPEDAPEIARSIEDGLIALLPEMPRSRDTLRQVLHSGSPRILSALLEIQGADPYRKIQADPGEQVALHDLYEDSDVARLRILHEAGIRVDSQFNALRQVLLSRTPPALLEFVLIECGLTDTLFPDFTLQMIRRASGPTAPVLAQCLESLTPDMRRACWREVVKQIAILIQMKPLAAALLSGEDLTKLLPRPVVPGHFPCKLRPLLEMTTTAHGRMALRKREPDLADLLARPENAAFFGITSKDLRE